MPLGHTYSGVSAYGWRFDRRESVHLLELPTELVLHRKNAVFYFGQLSSRRVLEPSRVCHWIPFGDIGCFPGSTLMRREGPRNLEHVLRSNCRFVKAHSVENKREVVIIVDVIQRCC